MLTNGCGWYINSVGSKCHVVDRKMHSDIGPAEFRTNGTEIFYRHGRLHRDNDLPAFVGGQVVNGIRTLKYAIDGKYHRDNGPAITWCMGPYKEEYWTNGILTKAISREGAVDYFGIPQSRTPYRRQDFEFLYSEISFEELI